jgi:hypothetical protein
MRTDIQTTIFVEHEGQNVEVLVTGILDEPRDYPGYPGQGDSVEITDAETMDGEPWILSEEDEKRAVARMMETA